MWYRKALDLSELNKQFPEERENVIDAVEEENLKQNVEDLMHKVRSGESWQSDSGAIKIEGEPRIEPPFTDEEVDGRFDNETTDAYEVFESIKEYPSTITTIKNTANTLSMFIDSGTLQEFHRKIDSLSPLLEKIIQSAWDKVQLMEKSFSDPILSSQFAREGYPRVSESEAILANRITLEITKAINDLYSSIRNDDAKQEWLNIMAKRGVAANFLNPKDKSRYKETMNRIWGLG